MEIKQYSVYWVNLDPVTGSEVSKTRPCVIISPDEMNRNLKTVIVAPLTHTLKTYPTRVLCIVSGQQGAIMLDQLRSLDKTRITSFIGKLGRKEINNIKAVIAEMLC